MIEEQIIKYSLQCFTQSAYIQTFTRMLYSSKSSVFSYHMHIIIRTSLHQIQLKFTVCQAVSLGLHIHTIQAFRYNFLSTVSSAMSHRLTIIPGGS